MLPGFCSETVRVSRAPLVDTRGAATRDWASAEAHEVPGCMVSHGSTATDFESDRELAVSRTAVLYAPPGSDIAEGDRVECRLGSFVVDGAPQAYDVPGSTIGHLRVQLSGWEG